MRMAIKRGYVSFSLFYVCKGVCGGGGGEEEERTYSVACGV